MRILHIVGHVREVGNGFVNAAVDLACLQAKQGHEVGVISSGGEYEELLKSCEVQHFLRIEKGGKLLRHVNALRVYWSIFDEFQPNIIHAHIPREVILACILKFRFHYAIVSTVHNEFQYRAIFTGLADRVIAVSQAVAQSMMRRGIPEQKVRVVVNGTLGSPRKRPIQSYPPKSLHQPAILTVAGMQQRKGIADLIVAFKMITAEFPQAHLYLVGDGPDRALFEAQVQQEGIASRVNFEGFQAEPQRYLLSAQIFVLASHKDPSPLVIPEAREAGCAIVATQVDGIPEALDRGEAGVLVPPKDSAALAEALRQLLKDPERLNQYKQRSQKNLEWLSVDRVVQQTLKVYDELYPSP
jgi:glycosyltransferase involved in cell wall biosynthesis